MTAKVYYNSACPVCRAGVDAQKSRMESCAITNVQWIDVHAYPHAVTETGSSLEQVRERIHMMDESGKIVVGADALTELWFRTPGQMWLGRLASLYFVRTLGTLAYNAFAKYLYAWNRRAGRW